MAKLLTLVAVLILSASTAWAQPSDWSRVSCDDAYLSYQGLNCYVHSATRTPGSDARATAARYGVSGYTGEGAKVEMMLWRPYGMTYMQAYTNADVTQAFKVGTVEIRDKATNWGELRAFGETSYMTFSLVGLECVAFDKPGPYLFSGYKWILRGYTCTGHGLGSPEAAVKKVLATVKVRE